MSHHCACKFEDGPNDNPGNGPAIYKCGFHAKQEREAEALRESLRVFKELATFNKLEAEKQYERAEAAEQQLAELRGEIEADKVRVAEACIAMQQQLAAERQRAAKIEAALRQITAFGEDHAGALRYDPNVYPILKIANDALAAKSAGAQDTNIRENTKVPQPAPLADKTAAGAKGGSDGS